MTSIMKRLTTVNENMKRIQEENNFYEAMELLKASVNEIKKVETSMFKRSYPTHCFPSIFSGSQEHYGRFKRLCEEYCIKNAKEFVQNFYEKKYPNAKQCIERLTQIELKT